MDFDKIGEFIYEVIRFVVNLIWGWITLVLNIVEKPFLWLFVKDPKTLPGWITTVIVQVIVVIIMLIMLISITNMVYKFMRKIFRTIRHFFRNERVK